MTISRKLKFTSIKRTLNFTFDAGTSRGILRQRDVYWILASQEGKQKIGWGEAAPLINLSPDFSPDFDEILISFLEKASQINWVLETNQILMKVQELIPFQYPSIRFGLESALLDLSFGGVKKYFENKFYDLQEPIPINGLIWMGNEEMMLQQINEKLEAGFFCIKLKIGAIDFEQELKLLKYIRDRFDQSQITLRVDANGAFAGSDAMSKLEKLATLDIHSIEQPIAAGQWDAMKSLCAESPLPIALDEELIGVETREELLDKIMPQHIILKPSLVGGIAATKAWINAAEERGIGWWMTSALESNVGLNVISQLASTFDLNVPHGLGTGKLYHNNLESPLTIAKGHIYYDEAKGWGMSS